MSNKQNPKKNISTGMFSSSKPEAIIFSSSKAELSILEKCDELISSRDREKSQDNEEIEKVFQSLTDDLIASWKQANKRIEEAQEAIQISKIETRVMLDYLKEITIDVG